MPARPPTRSVTPTLPPATTRARRTASRSRSNAEDLGPIGELLAAAGRLATPDAGAARRGRRAPPAAEEHRVIGTLEHFVRGDEHRYAEGPFQVALDLGDGFALNQPLSAFALAVLEMFDPESPGYALDVVSVIEATLDDPRPVLMAQRFEARGEAVGAMKADGMEYEERMDALDDVTWPRPLVEELEAALRVYRQTHPWVDPRGLSPKSVVREMYERAMTFGEFVAHHKLFRAEGVVLRYLTDAYRALRSTVPTSARTEELDDIVEWLGEVVRHTDSSLLDEWEALANPSDEALTEVRVPSENRALSANPRALRVMVRQSMFRRIELVSLGRFAALAALDGGLTQDEWARPRPGYRAEYDDLGTGPQARGPAFSGSSRSTATTGWSPRSSRTPTATATGGSPPSSTSQPPTRPASSCWSRPASAPPERVRRRRPRSPGSPPAARGHRAPVLRTRRRPGRLLLQPGGELHLCLLDPPLAQVPVTEVQVQARRHPASRRDADRGQVVVGQERVLQRHLVPGHLVGQPAAVGEVCASTHRGAWSSTAVASHCASRASWPPSRPCCAAPTAAMTSSQPAHGGTLRPAGTRPSRAPASVAPVTTMQPGTVHDLPGVYRVCLLTGAAGADATALHDDPDLLGHLWAGPYLAFPDAVTRVLRDEHGVAGYCLAVPDTRAFEQWVEQVWLPPLRARHPLGSGSTPADAAVVEHLQRPPSRMPGCSSRTRPTSTSTSCRGSRARAGGDAWSSRCWRASRRPGPPVSTWAWTRATPVHSGSTSGSASPSWRAHRAPASTACRSGHGP